MWHNSLVVVNACKVEPDSYSHHSGYVWIFAEFLANVLGQMFPSTSFVERHVAAEYLRLVEQPGDVGEIVDSRNPTTLCPSYPVATSARVIAKRTKTFRSFRYLDQPAPLVSNDEALKHVELGLRDVRLSGPCITKGCAHWAGSSCRLGSAVATIQLRTKPPKSCPIRKSCRWYLENSDNACKACKFLPHSKLFDLTQIHN